MIYIVETSTDKGAIGFQKSNNSYSFSHWYRAKYFFAWLDNKLPYTPIAADNLVEWSNDLL